MLFGTPVSWLLAEILSLVLLFICMIHASKQEDGIIKILEIFCFVIASAIFENIGVFTHTYDYDVHRIMMIGKVPLEILLLEAEIWYAAMLLARRMNVPKWSQPLVVGLFASVQDMTVDPAAVFDTHLFDGAMSGQWNWAGHYDNAFFGIPFFNFSGWLYLMAYYSAFTLIGEWLYRKSGKKGVGYAYPFIASILTPLCIVTPVTVFLLFGTPVVPMNTRAAELILLCVNYAIPIAVLFLYRNRLAKIDLRTDGIAFLLPVALHLYDAVYAVALGNTIAYAPVAVVTVIHLAYLGYILFKSRRLATV